MASLQAGSGMQVTAVAAAAVAAAAAARRHPQCKLTRCLLDRTFLSLDRLYASGQCSIATREAHRARGGNGQG